MRVCVSSLKFSPAHVSHMIAYAKLFREIGFEPFLWLEKNYEKMDLTNEFQVVWYQGSIPDNADLLFFANNSLVNYRFFKEFVSKGSKAIYLYHEPWERFDKYLKEGFKQALKATVGYYFSTKSLKYVTLVIVPSGYALKLYNKTCLKYNKNVVMIPLLFDDELDHKMNSNTKVHFSYIGHAVKGHMFREYIELIKTIYLKESTITFEIATRTDITKLLNHDRILLEMIDKGILIVSQGRPLTNEEINQAYERSFCVWNVYRRSTQSGVLPKAFMFGTPVIASNLGSFPEFVRDGENGYLVDDYSFESLYKKLILVNENIGIMSQNCRNTFEKTFYWKAQVDKMRQIIENVLK